MATDAGPTMGEMQDRLRVLVLASTAPLCVHDLAQQAGRDPTRLGAVLVALGFLDRMRRGGVFSKPTIGGAGVVASVPDGSQPPSDFFFWSLQGGAGGTPAGLARFGAGWQGALLAERVRNHALQFPLLYYGLRGVPKPDLTV